MAAIYKNVEAFIRGDGLDIYRHTCPICGKPITAQALVSEFMSEPEWIFYGQQGQRVKVCEGFMIDIFFTHFAVKLPSGAVSHRLAWEKPQ